MADSYLPPVVIDILGTADSFTRTIQYVQAQLKSLSGDRGDPKILATDTDFEAKVATVTTTLKTVSKMVAKPKIIPTTDAVTNAVVMTTAAWQALNEMIARPLIEPRVDMTALSALLGSASSRALMPGAQMLALPPGEMGLMQYIPPGGLMPYGGQTGGAQDWAYYAAAAAADRKSVV